MAIRRNEYLDKIKPFIDKPMVKVITGIRRSGKSELMKSLKELFIEKGVADSHVLYLNFESFLWDDIKQSRKLYDYVMRQMTPSGHFYLLLDEIQEVEEWEKAVNALMVDADVDVYITGSNSNLLSSELSTYITGRYVEISMRTLSFAEYLSFHQMDRNTISEEDCRVAFVRYLRQGGFPSVNIADYDEENAYKIVFDIYSSILLRDTVQRNKIRNTEMLERVAAFVMDNVGNIVNAKNIADYFKSQYRKVDNETIYNYLKAMESAFLIERVPRYDMKGKEMLRTNEKYYMADLSLIYAVLGFRMPSIGGLLENLVYLQLRRRGYNVFVGKLDNLEMDFVARRKDKTVYVQVAYQISDAQTLQRELKPLQAVRDNFPKYLVTMDILGIGNIEGINHVHIADFLLDFD